MDVRACGKPVLTNQTQFDATCPKYLGGAKGTRTPDSLTASLVWTVPLTCDSTVHARQNRYNPSCLMQFSAVGRSWTSTRAPGLLQLNRCEMDSSNPSVLRGGWNPLTVNHDSDETYPAGQGRRASTCRPTEDAWAVAGVTSVTVVVGHAVIFSLMVGRTGLVDVRHSLWGWSSAERGIS